MYLFVWGFSVSFIIVVFVGRCTENDRNRYNERHRQKDRPTDRPFIGSYKRRNDEISEILLVDARGHNVKVCPKINMGETQRICNKSRYHRNKLNPK